jgi:hypothetical protein
MADLRRLWRAQQEEEDSAYAKRVQADLGEFDEYGLSFDYVPTGTFTGQKRGYWRYQLSWGGPSDEFRFYGDLVSEYRVVLDRVEYWFMDWFDGHGRKLRGGDEALMSEIFEDFVEMGVVSQVYE